MFPRLNGAQGERAINVDLMRESRSRLHGRGATGAQLKRKQERSRRTKTNGPYTVWRIIEN